MLDDLPASDLPRVVSILLRGTFQAAGQNCIGIERIIALPRIYPQLLAQLTPRVRALRPGSALDSPLDHSIDVGACVSAAGFDGLEELIAEAVAQGARLLAGGTRLAHPRWPRGHYFAPTLLADVTPAMRIARAELFAPVMLVLRAASLPAAVDIANGTPYALGASVFGSDPVALETVVRDVRAGMVAVNDFAVYYAVQLPFGGLKGSGYGRFAGEEGLRAVCNTKAVCRDRWPWAVKTAIPKPLDLPLGEERRAWEVARGVVELGYGDLRGRVGGLRRVVGL